MMKLSSIALAWVSLALPALAQDVTLSCTYPFGDHSLGVLASNSGSDSKDCQAGCGAHDSADDTGLLIFTVQCEGSMPGGASGLLLCSRGGYQGGALENAQVVGNCH